MNNKKLIWHTEKRKIDDLVPYEGNPRQMTEKQKEDLEESLKRFNLMSIPVVNTDNIIISGHQRLKILQLLGRGQESIDVRMPNRELTPRELREANLRENKNLGSWDYNLLANIDKGVLLDVGFTEEELDDKFHLIEEKGKEDGFDVDKALKEIKEPICKTGDIWQLGEHRLMCGDATIEEDIKKLMNGEKADIVFTDPPYNALKSWNKDEAKSECRLDPSKWFRNDNMEWNDYKKFLLSSFSGFTGHSVYICCDFRVYPLITEAIIKNGWDLKHCIVWVKNVWGLGKRYRFQHEFIVYASKKDAPFFGDRSQSDVWNIDVDRNSEHNTPKPITLCANAIDNSSKINDIVLDLFGGSGSTLIACEQLKRICYMMEIDPIYCDVIIKRWETHTNKKAVKINENKRCANRRS